MGLVLAALVPVFLIIALGAILRRVLLPEPAHWAALEKLTYFVLFPALLIVSAVKANLSELNILAIAATLIGTILALSGLILVRPGLMKRALGTDGPGFTSVFQGAVRWNTYVVFAVAGGLYGAKGITIVAVAMVVMIPVVNILAVLVLAAFSGRAAPTAGYIGGQLARNPYLWACAIGGLLNAFAVPVPKVIVEFGDVLGRASLALGLLVVGSGLDLGAMVKPKLPVMASLTLKLLVKPLIAVVIGLLLGLSGLELSMVAVIAAVPSAPNGYVLARQMGGDAPLLAEILTMQIIAATVTLPLVVALTKLVA